jgi:hypothetical protein
VKWDQTREVAVAGVVAGVEC